MAFANLSFESGSTGPGEALDWTITSQSSYEVAGFTDGSAESFESGWNTNEDFLFSFDDPLTIQVHEVSTLPPTPFKPVENFEELWNSNENYVFGGVAFAGTVMQFDATLELYEDFEEEWSSNETYKFSFLGVGVDLAVANFDLTPEAFEDFEEDWSAGYKFAFVGPGTDLTLFTLVGGELAENFEGTDPWPTMTTV